MPDTATPIGRGLPPAPEAIHLARPSPARVDLWRLVPAAIGVAALAALVLAPLPPDAVDPGGRHFALTAPGKAALGLFAFAAIWWAFDVVPIGVTAAAVGALQAVLLIRPAHSAFRDFMDPAVWFVFGSLVLGMALTRSGLARRIAYGTLALVGERTSAVYLGCFAMTAALTLVMAHTAVATAVYPLLMAIGALYGDSDRPTRFGKGLFIGTAFATGAGSVVSLFGSGRAPVAVGLFRTMTGRDVSFFEVIYYMLPLGWTMVLLVWAWCTWVFPPERKVVAGLHARASMLYERLGPIARDELVTIGILAAMLLLLAIRPFVAALASIDTTAIVLACSLLYFVIGPLGIRDLEEMPWNIVLLFGGAISLALCIWETGAAHWLALTLLASLGPIPPLAFVVALAALMLVMTNVILNVAAVAIGLPVALVIGGYVGVAPEVILFAFLAAAGAPFLLVMAAAPNAIAYESGQFTAGEFFAAGVPVGLAFVAVLAAYAWLIWPLMGMPVLAR